MIKATLTSDTQQQVFELLSRASNVSFATAEGELPSISQLIPGQRVTAEVLSMLPNNRVEVQVGAERFNLELPMPARVGQNLEMTFISANPRSTFAVANKMEVPPPVTLSDASRLLSILITGESTIEPNLRSSLLSVSDLLRRSSGETAVLANILDEALVYTAAKEPVVSSVAGKLGQLETTELTLGQARLANFEINASQLLKNIAQNSRVTLIEAANNPVNPLPLIPGEEINATVIGNLFGGRTMVLIAGVTLELQLSQKVVPGDILRLTYLSSEPKPTFAAAKAVSDVAEPPSLSAAGRWLSVLEHTENGVSSQQAYILNRLNTVLKSLPPGSPVFSVISDDAVTYQRTPQLQLLEGSEKTLLGREQNQAVSGNSVIMSDGMAKLLQAVIKGDRIALLEAINHQSSGALFAPGEQLKGEVLAAIGGGRFSVQVAGQVLEFLMPKGVMRGDLINLFFITEEPRLTFLMVRFGGGKSIVSDTGRWLSTLLGEATTQVPAQATLNIMRSLLSESTSDAHLLGQMLYEGLRDSGLFYESHLARWFGGDYKLTDILKEPQGRLSPRLMQVVEQNMSQPDESALSGIKNGSTEIMEALLKQAGTNMAHDGIADKRSLPVVNEQLSALQNGQILFRSDIFQNQHLEWSVAEREAGRNKSGERERSWDSGITLTLPNLGEISAKIKLDATGISVKFIADKSETISALESGRARLLEQFEGAGLKTLEMSIHNVAR